MEKQSLSMNAKNPVSTELLQQLLNASDIGWWQLDFGKREMTCSPLAAELFSTDRTRITFDEVCLLPREEHRAQIYTRCAALKVTDTLDETFVTTNGNKCLQIKAVKVRTDPRTNTRTAFGSVRRVTSGNPESAELAAMLGSLFYIGITAGRLVSGFVSEKLGDKRLIRIGIAVMMAGIVQKTPSFAAGSSVASKWSL